MGVQNRPFEGGTTTYQRVKNRYHFTQDGSITKIYEMGLE